MCRSRSEGYSSTIPWDLNPSGWVECHRHASAVIVAMSPRSGAHPNLCLAAAEEATRDAGSPGLREPISTAISLPTASAHARTTSRLLYPFPFPRLYCPPASPLAKASSASRCAFARSQTCR